MGGPAGDAGDGKDGSVELNRQTQHLVGEAGVEVDVGRDALVDLAPVRNDFRSQTRDQLIEGILLLVTLFSGELLDKALEGDGAGVGDRIDGMTEAIDQTGFVKDLSVQKVTQILLYLSLICPVPDLFLHVREHLDDLDIGAAVTGPLEGAQSRRNGGVGVCTGGRDQVGGKGGVITAAVLCVKNQADV